MKRIRISYFQDVYKNLSERVESSKNKFNVNNEIWKDLSDSTYWGVWNKVLRKLEK